MRLNLLFKTLLLAGLTLPLGLASAQELPPPNTIISGIPLSTQYDDGYSYSVKVLDYFYPDAGWDAAAGTGVLGLIVTTRSGGADNSDYAGYNIPDPTINGNGNHVEQIVDYWGVPGTTGSSTYMYVTDLARWLSDSFNGSTVPIFTFDQNETGSEPDLQVVAKVEIFASTTDADAGINALHTWSFDNTTQPDDGTYDPASLVNAPGTLCIPDVLDKSQPPGTADQVCFNNNAGSGAFDGIVYVPTMNLADWDEVGYIFKMSWIFENVDNGGEEITITGAFAPRQVPEPGVLSLLGLGLLGMGMLRRRKAT